MKKFLRFLIIVLIIGGITYECYYLVNLNKEYKVKEPISIPNIQENNEKELENNKDNNEKVLEPANQDENKNKNVLVFPEDLEESSGEVEENPKEEPIDESEEETQIDSGEIVDKIKELYIINNESNIDKTFEEKIGADILGETYEELFKMLKVDSTLVNIQIAGTMVHLLPYSDFIDEQEFHYDEDGNLVMYQTRGSGTGVVTDYYFHEGTLIERVFDSTDEGDGEIPDTDNISVDEVIARSKVIYDKYLK